MRTVMLVHGGLWDGTNAEQFWHRPGVAHGLRRRGFDVLTPDRVARPASWTEEVEPLAERMTADPAVVVAGSNGCSAAVRLAVARPDAVARLLLAWPATPVDDGPTRAALGRLGAPAAVVDRLLAGETLRGVTDDELRGLAVPVGVLPPVPDNATHRRSTVDALLELIPGAVELRGCPEAPRPEFGASLEDFLETVAGFANR